MEPERIKVMRFAENNRISHRQLFRQIILVFPAPFLLCLFKNGAMLGISAMAGTAAAAVVLSFYVIWLIRLTPAYGELSKRIGSFTVRFIGLFFLVYVIVSSAFLSGLLGEVIPESLISGISGKWLSLLAVAVAIAKITPTTNAIINSLNITLNISLKRISFKAIPLIIKVPRTDNRYTQHVFSLPRRRGRLSTRM